MKETEKLYGKILLINAMAQQMKQQAKLSVRVKFKSVQDENVLNSLFEKLTANDIKVIGKDLKMIIRMEYCTIILTAPTA